MDSSVSARRGALIEAAVDAAHISHCPGTIKTAFRVAGLFPWNKSLIVNDPMLVTSTVTTSTAQQVRNQRGPQISGKVLVNPAATFRVANMCLPAVTDGSMSNAPVVNAPNL